MSDNTVNFNNPIKRSVLRVCKHAGADGLHAIVKYSPDTGDVHRYVRLTKDKANELLQKCVEQGVAHEVVSDERQIPTSSTPELIQQHVSSSSSGGASASAQPIQYQDYDAGSGGWTSAAIANESTGGAAPASWEAPPSLAPPILKKADDDYNC